MQSGGKGTALVEVEFSGELFSDGSEPWSALERRHDFGVPFTGRVPGWTFEIIRIQKLLGKLLQERVMLLTFTFGQPFK